MPSDWDAGVRSIRGRSVKIALRRRSYSGRTTEVISSAISSIV